MGDLSTAGEVGLGSGSGSGRTSYVPVPAPPAKASLCRLALVEHLQAPPLHHDDTSSPSRHQSASPTW